MPPLELSLPEEYQAAARFLAQVDDDYFRRLEGALSNREAILGRTARRATGDNLPLEDPRWGGTPPLDELFRFVVALRLSTDDSNEEPRAVADAAARSGDLALSQEEGKRMSDRLLALLLTPAASIASKVLDLNNEVGATVVESRVITDLRPVFDAVGPDAPRDKPGPPVGFIVLNTLRLEYRSNGERRTFDVTIDERALLELEAEIARARGKVSEVEGVVESQLEMPVFQLRATPRRSA